jgi:GT2 family glycosyltransferase
MSSLPARGIPAGAAAAPPEVSVVVPHLNQPEPLAACLAALARQTIAPGRFEVIVVDNGSTPPPAAVVAGFPGVRLLHEPRPGPGPARNRGAALARAAILAFLDADCIPEPDWLRAILEGFAADPGAALLGGAVRVFPQTPGRPNPAEAFELVYGFRQQWQIARHGFAATANLAVRRTVFERVGPFAGIDVAEDLDWGTRARAKGFAVRFAPDAVVRHPARRSMAELRRQWDRHISHHWSMQPKSLRGRAEWALRAAAMAASPAAEIPRVLASDRLAGPGQRLAALRGVAAMRLYRARRMLAELLHPPSRQRSARWNRT